MTQQEFNERIGRETTIEEYEYANGMYMGAGNVDKDTFCKDYKALMQNKSARAIFDELLNEKQQRRAINKRHKQTIDLLIQQHHETEAEPLRVHAILLAGEEQYLLRKITLGLEFDHTDYEIVANIIELSKQNF